MLYSSDQLWNQFKSSLLRKCAHYAKIMNALLVPNTSRISIKRTISFVFVISSISIHVGSALINCYEPFQCSNVSLSNDYINCGGESTCNQLDVRYPSNAVWCHGANACFYLDNTNVNSATYIWCSGVNSCLFSKLRATEYIYCHGFKSCLQSEIRRTGRVYAYGAYSLWNSIIDSEGVTGELFVYLRGYNAGYNTTIICRVNNNCTINHYFNGFYTTYTIETNEVSDRRMNISEYMEPDMTSFHQLEDVMKDSDEICNDPSRAIAADTASSYTDYFNANRSICCRAYHSCGSVHVQNTATTSNIVCSAYYGCYQRQLTNDDDGAVICLGRNSCASSNISNAKSAYCLSHYDCPYSLMENIINITCAGGESCSNAVITTKGTGESYYFRFIGYYSGYNANINCKASDKCAVLCDAYRACDGTEITCNNNCNVTCIGTYCPNILPQSSPSKQITSAPNYFTSTITLNVTDEQSTTLRLSATATKYSDDEEEDAPRDDMWLFIAISAVATCLVSASCACFYYRNKKKKSVADTTMMEVEQVQPAVAAKAKRDPVSELTEEEKHEEVENKEKQDVKQNEPCEVKMNAYEMDKNEKETVRIWLVSTVRLPQYFPIFIQNGYESLDFIAKINDKAELIEIGITSAGHLTQIMGEIQQLCGLNEGQRGNKKNAAAEDIELEGEIKSDDKDEELFEQQPMSQETEGVNQNTTDEDHMKTTSQRMRIITSTKGTKQFTEMGPTIVDDV